MIPENCLFAHPPSHPKKVSICHHHLLIIGELKHWRRRRQQERQKKTTGLDWKTTTFLVHHAFFFKFLCRHCLELLRRENAYSSFARARSKGFATLGNV